MNFGISTASFYPILPEKAIELLYKNGVANIEIFFNTFSEVEKGYLTELRKAIDNYGQKVLAVHPFTCAFEPFMLFTEYERRFNDAIEAHKYYFNAMNLLDAKIFIFHGDRCQSTLSDEKYYERFATLRDVGKQFGITVAQENVERCKSGSLNFLVNMVKFLDGDVSIVFDNKQAVRSGVSHKDFINALGNNIIHLHLSDNNEKCDCLGIGNGTFDIKSMLQHISKFNSNCNVIIELYSNLLDGIDDIFLSFEFLTSIQTVELYPKNYDTSKYN